MFQYAIGRHLSLAYNTELKLDLSLLLDRTPKEHFVFRNYDLACFNIKASLADFSERMPGRYSSGIVGRLIDTIRRRLTPFPYKIVLEPHFHFSPDILKCGDNAYLAGYWQSYKYFEAIADTIRNDFAFHIDDDQRFRDVSRAIESADAVCVHVRRGDYISNPVARKTHGHCELEYYERAFNIINGNIRSPHFFVFSDDIEWCRANMRAGTAITYVDGEYAGGKYIPCFKLMTLCKHFIICNSTFSWWAAWLNPGKNKTVIAPARWFNDISFNTKDLIPKEWIKI